MSMKDPQILDLLAHKDKKRMHDTPQNAKYTSKTTNELLHASAEVITEKITDEIRRARFFFNNS